MRLEAVFEPNIEVVCLGVVIPLLERKRLAVRSGLRMVEVRMT